MTEPRTTPGAGPDGEQTAAQGRPARSSRVAAGALALAVALVPVAPSLAFASGPTTGLVGAPATYRLSVRDLPGNHGFTERYQQSLEVAGHRYDVADARLSRLAPNTPVRFDGAITGDRVRLTSVQATGAPPAARRTGDSRTADARTTGSSRTAAGATHVVKDLVILANWNGPDTKYTQASAQDEVANDDAWFREVSYGQEGITAIATPWVTIADPGADCDENAILDGARAAAATAGYDYTLYDRTLVYFPLVTSCPWRGISGIGADWSLFDGSLSTSLTTHEQGHELGLYHAHSYICPDRGAPSVPMADFCDGDEYGDPYDSMGRGGAVHFNAAEKDQIGWLGGRKVDLTPGASATLAPLEQQADGVQVAEVTVSDFRKYYIEYRQPIGLDTYLAYSGGATHGFDGVLIHAVDPYSGYGDIGSLLLDMSPDANLYDATLKTGQSWTTPEGYTIDVGALRAGGADISLRGPALQVPGAPGTPTAVAGDAAASVSWTAPASDGGSPITGYRVTASPGGAFTTTGGSGRSATVTGLTNGVSYTFSVTATNNVGAGPASASSTAVTPHPAATTTTYQEGLLRLKGWSAVSAPAASGGSYRASSTVGDSASFTFAGTAVTWLARGGPASGQASVTIDGTGRGTVDLYRAAAAGLSLPYGGLSAGSHTIVVKPLGTKNAASTGAMVSVDAFTVDATTTQDSAAKVAYSGWVGVLGASASGGAFRSSATTGNTASFSFTGTAVSWVTATGPAYGKAQVLIDGVARGTFDQYSATQQWKLARSFAGLAAGTHTLQIKVLGTKNAASTAKTVVLDAVTVTS